MNKIALDEKFALFREHWLDAGDCLVVPLRQLGDNHRDPARLVSLLQSNTRSVDGIKGNYSDQGHYGERQKRGQQHIGSPRFLL